jgi:hypothetical protein
MNTSTRFVVAAAAILFAASFATLPASADEDEPVAIAAPAPADAPEIFPAPAVEPVLELVVFAGGPSAEVVGTRACAGGAPALFWTYVDGQLVRFSPEWDAVQRAPWESAFSSGIPSMTPVGIDCR